MTVEERNALIAAWMGKTVRVVVDRPVGYRHWDMVYPINYGYIPGVLGGDGEELDVYLLGVEEPVEAYDAEIIAIVHRHNDVEDKLVGAPKGTRLSAEEIAQAVHFQEQYYDSEIEIQK